MCSLENGLWLLRYAGRTTPRIMKRWSKKTAANVKKKNQPHKLKGNAERERHDYIIPCIFSGGLLLSDDKQRFFPSVKSLFRSDKTKNL